jgi:hypothetical protein
MRARLAVVMIVLGTLPALAHEGCGEMYWSPPLDAPLDGLEKTSFETESEHYVQGTEWEVYTTRDKQLHTIIRNDLGEGHRRNSRLAILNAHQYLITTTHHAYSGNLFAGDPDIIIQDIQSETGTFCFTDGKLWLPDVLDENGDYAKQGADARQWMVLDEAVAKYTTSLPK